MILRILFVAPSFLSSCDFLFPLVHPRGFLIFELTSIRSIAHILFKNSKAVLLHPSCVANFPPTHLQFREGTRFPSASQQSRIWLAFLIRYFSPLNAISELTASFYGFRIHFLFSLIPGHGFLFAVAAVAVDLS